MVAGVAFANSGTLAMLSALVSGIQAWWQHGWQHRSPRHRLRLGSRITAAYHGLPTIDTLKHVNKQLFVVTSFMVPPPACSLNVIPRMSIVIVSNIRQYVKTSFVTSS